MYTGALPSDAYPVSVALKQAIYARKLPAIGISVWEYAGFESIPDDARISREDLIKFAESKAQKPEFLYPGERIPF
jgi:hypothetical protein